MITDYIKQKVMAALDTIAIARSRKRQKFGRIWVGDAPESWVHRRRWGHGRSPMFTTQNGQFCGTAMTQSTVTVDIPKDGHNYVAFDRLYITIHEQAVYCSHTVIKRAEDGTIIACGPERLADQCQFDINSPGFDDTVIDGIVSKVVAWVEDWVS